MNTSMTDGCNSRCPCAWLSTILGAIIEWGNGNSSAPFHVEKTREFSLTSLMQHPCHSLGRISVALMWASIVIRIDRYQLTYERHVTCGLMYAAPPSSYCSALFSCRVCPRAADRQKDCIGCDRRHSPHCQCMTKGHFCRAVVEDEDVVTVDRRWSLNDHSSRHFAACDNTLNLTYISVRVYAETLLAIS